MHEEKQVIELKKQLEEKEIEVQKYKDQIAKLVSKITRQQEQNTKEKVELKIQYNVAKHKKEFEDMTIKSKYQLNAKDSKIAELTTILLQTQNLGTTNTPLILEELEFE